MIKILKIFYFLLIIIISSFGIYFCYNNINFNSEYVSTEGIASKDSICEDVDIFKNNDKIGKKISCKTFIKYPPAVSSSGESYDPNTEFYNYFIHTKKKYAKDDKITVYYIPENDPSKTATLNLIPTNISWIAITICVIAILFSIFFLVFINK